MWPIIPSVLLVGLGIVRVRLGYRRRILWIEIPERDDFQFAFVTASGLELERSHPGTVELPVSFLRTLIQDGEFGRIARLEKDYVHDIAMEVAEDGLQHPLIIVVDPQKVCLQDGHHRVVGSYEIDRDSFPVRLTRSEGIRKHSVPIGDLLDILWKRSM